MYQNWYWTSQWFVKWMLNRYNCTIYVLICWLCVLCLVAQSCSTLCDPLDCKPPGSSVNGILQARILEWVAMPSSRGTSQPRDLCWLYLYAYYIQESSIWWLLLTAWLHEQVLKKMERTVTYPHWRAGSVQFSSVAQLCQTLCDPMDHSMPGLPVHHQLSEFTQTHACWVSDTIQPSHPLSPPPPAFNLSQHQVSNESVLRIRWPKYWSFHFNISLSNEYSGQISFRMDWLDLLVILGTLKSLLQHHSSKASILQHSARFTVQLSHPYTTTGKTIALNRQTAAGKLISLLFNMLSRLVITFLPRSKHVLISWLQSSSAVISGPPKIKPVTVSTVSPSICHGVMGPDTMILVFWMLNFKPTFSLSSFTFIKRLFSSSLFAIRVVSSAYLRLLINLLASLIPAYASSSPVFLIMYSAYELNKQGDNIEPWCTSFLIWNQSVVPCPVLTVASWPAYRFLKR